MNEVPLHYRTVRSYVRRGGRLTAGQERALERLWPQLGLDRRPGALLDLDEVFGNPRPVSLEIGFGNGETLVELATSRPDENFLGVEVHQPGIGGLLLELDRRALTNVRLLREDAVDLLQAGLPPASLAAVYLLFPDPWPKQRHHKRRILQGGLVELVARVLRPGGLFHAVTDWSDYAEQMLSQIEAAGDRFENLAGPGQFAPRPSWRPLTRFERRGLRLGHSVWDLAFRRR